MKTKRPLTKILYIQSQNADPSPPIGTILGNVGINTAKFCEEFNKFSKSLSLYFTVKVKIEINDNKTFTFSILSISLSNLFKLLKYKPAQEATKEIYYIKLKDVILLSLFKFPKYDIQNSFDIVLGIAKSMNIKIIK
jgi:large subunit ribosomal protein L11